MKKTFAVWMGLGLAAVALTAQAEVRSITEKLPHVSENAPIPVEGCKQLTKYTGNFKPVIPDGATFLSNRVSGYVDDACDLGSTKIGHGSCAPYEFGATIVDGCGTDGSFSITVYDETSPGNVQGVNLVELNATCETFYDLPTNSPPMPPGGTNDTGRADCDENEPCDCKGGKQKPTPPAEPGATPTGWTKCPQDDSGCGGCGSPRPRTAPPLREFPPREGNGRLRPRLAVQLGEHRHGVGRRDEPPPLPPGGGSGFHG